MKSNFSKIIFSSCRAAKGEWMSTPGCARGYSYRALSEPLLHPQLFLYSPVNPESRFMRDEGSPSSIFDLQRSTNNKSSYINRIHILSEITCPLNGKWINLFTFIKNSFPLMRNVALEYKIKVNRAGLYQVR
jgi:hypothetical protein